MYIYLITPYSAVDQYVEEERFEAAVEACVHLMNWGVEVYSPIVHWHVPYRKALDSGFKWTGDYRFFKEQNTTMIAGCRQAWVATIPGYKESFGVQDDLAEAGRCSRDSYYLNFERLVKGEDPWKLLSSTP